jgi:CRISPR-associated endonuclease/helicase Cas3
MKPDFAAHTPSKGSEQWHKLKHHLHDVRDGTQRYTEKFGAGALGHYAGPWHDLGKYNPEFQKYLTDCSTGDEQARSVPHAVHGAILAAKLIPPITPLIYGHHGRLPQIQEMSQQRINAPSHQPIYQTILAQAEAIGIDLKPSDDWKAEVSGFKDPLHYELFLRLLFSCLVDADFLDTEKPKFWLQASQLSLDIIWNYAEDDIYQTVLEQ